MFRRLCFDWSVSLICFSIFHIGNSDITSQHNYVSSALKVNIQYSERLYNVVDNIVSWKNYNFMKLFQLNEKNSFRQLIVLPVPNWYLISFLQYVSECWTISLEIKKKLEETELWFCWKNVHLSWSELVRNENIWREMETRTCVFRIRNQNSLKFPSNKKRIFGEFDMRSTYRR